MVLGWLLSWIDGRRLIQEGGRHVRLGEYMSVWPSRRTRTMDTSEERDDDTGRDGKAEREWR